MKYTNKPVLVKMEKFCIIKESMWMKKIQRNIAQFVIKGFVRVLEVFVLTAAQRWIWRNDHEKQKPPTFIYLGFCSNSLSS